MPRRPDRRPLLPALIRALRVLAHLAHGARALAPASGQGFRRLPHTQVLQWSRALCAILDLRIEAAGPAPGHGLIVMNHVSWLDIVVLNSIAPSRFVSKAEVAHWPIIGALARRAGTVYLERGSATAALRANQFISDALEAGERVALFPEGTTSVGEHVLPFKAALLQPAIDHGADAHPASVRYVGRDGLPAHAAGFTGGQSLAASVWMLLRQPGLSARVCFGSPVAARGQNRRRLAAALRATICAQLGKIGTT